MMRRKSNLKREEEVSVKKENKMESGENNGEREKQERRIDRECENLRVESVWWFWDEEEEMLRRV